MTPWLVTFSILIPPAAVAVAVHAADCARLSIARVVIPKDCVDHPEGCFAEVRLPGLAKRRINFRPVSDGSEEGLGFSRACQPLNLTGADVWPPGCVVSINFGGPAGAAGAQCVCTGGGEACRPNDL